VTLLEPNPGGMSIVLAGAWNRAIFTPQWMIGRLTQATDINIEVPLGNPSLAIRFLFDRLTLRVENDRLIIVADHEDPDSLQRAQKVAVKILEDLPHTPIKGAGINLQFLAGNPEPNGKLISMFRLSDDGSLADAHLKVMATSIERKISDDKQIITLLLSYQEDSKILVSLNFHTEAKTAEDAKICLSNDLKQITARAAEILESVYGATLNQVEEFA